MMQRSSAMIVVILVLWLAASAMALSQEVSRPSTLGIAICAAIIVAPIVLLKLKRLPVYLIAAYAALVPFDNVLVTGSGTMFLKLLGIVIAVAILFAVVMSGRIVVPSKMLLLVLLLAAYSGASVFWALDPSRSISTYGSFLSYVAFFVALCLYPVEAQDVRLIVIGIITGGLLAAGYGDFLFLHGQQLSDQARLELSYGEHMTDPNLFAAALLTPISLILVLFLRTHNALKKLLWLAALLTLVYGFVATSSRGAAISFGVIVAFLLLRSRYAKQLSLIAALSAIVVFASPLAQRFMAPDLASADFRSDIWKVAFASLHQYWVLGAGFGNFDNAFAQYFLSVPHQPLFWQAASHSVLILAAVEGGITGLVLMLVLWYCMFRNLASIHADGLAKDICLGLRAAVLGLFVAGLSLDLMMEKYTWLLFALVVMVGSTLRADEQAQEPERAIPIPAAQHLMQPIGS